MKKGWKRGHLTIRYQRADVCRWRNGGETLKRWYQGNVILRRKVILSLSIYPCFSILFLLLSSQETFLDIHFLIFLLSQCNFNTTDIVSIYLWFLGKPHYLSSFTLLSTHFTPLGALLHSLRMHVYVIFKWEGGGGWRLKRV